MQAPKIEITITPRTTEGKKVKLLRQAGRTPANVYGLGKPSQSVELDAKNFHKQFLAHPDASLVYLVMADSDEKSTPALLDLVSTHSVTGEILHVTFRRVSLKEKITTEVPLVLVGEVEIPETTVVQVMDEIEIEALPTDIPEHIEVDITSLAVAGDMITLGQLVYDKGKIKLNFTEEELTQPVVLLQEVKEEVVEVVEPEVVVEGEAGVEGEKEGEKGSEEVSGKGAGEDKSTEKSGEPSDTKADSK